MTLKDIFLFYIFVDFLLLVDSINSINYCNLYRNILLILSSCYLLFDFIACFWFVFLLFKVFFVLIAITLMVLKLCYIYI